MQTQRIKNFTFFFFFVSPHVVIISYGQEGEVSMAAENKQSLKGILQHLYFGRHGSLEICR